MINTIITIYRGTEMGTKLSNYQEFLNLWNLFEKEIKYTDKFKPNNIAGFAKYYLKTHSEEDISVKNFKRKIERWKEGIDKKRNFQKGTISKLEIYHKSINEEYFKEELLNDESFEYWFD